MKTWQLSIIASEQLTLREFDPWGHIDTHTHTLACTHKHTRTLWFNHLSAFISKYKIAGGETWVIFGTAVEQFTLSDNIILLAEHEDKLQNKLKEIVWHVGKCAYSLACQELETTHMCAQEKWSSSQLTVSLALHKEWKRVKTASTALNPYKKMKCKNDTLWLHGFVCFAI